MKVTGAQYLDIHTDVKNAGMDALFHYLSFGQTEGRQVDLPELPTDWDWQVYLAGHKDLRDAGLTTQAQAEDHYLKYGYKERRWPVPGQGWKPPTTQGLHLILDIPGSGRPLFTGMRFGAGLLVGDYGGHLDGAQIQYWDGKALTIEKKFKDPKAESAFHLVMAPDGVPICSLELYCQMARRENGVWKLTYQTKELTDLAFGIFSGGGSLYCFCCQGGQPDSWMLRSQDNGRSWQRIKSWNISPQGCANCDDAKILLTSASSHGGYPVIRDMDSNIVAQRPDLSNREYTQICGRNGRWNFAGNTFDGGNPWIDYWESGDPATVFNSNRKWAMWSEADRNSENRVVLFGAWKEPVTESQMAFSKDGGKTWDQATVPCPCLFGSHFADGGVYLFGGDWGSGRVYFYKF